MRWRDIPIGILMLIGATCGCREKTNVTVDGQCSVTVDTSAESVLVRTQVKLVPVILPTLVKWTPPAEKP